MAAPGTILVYVGLDLLGDGLIKLPFARALRNAFSKAHITWLAGKGGSVFAGPLAPLVEGLIDEVVKDAGVGSRVGQLLGDPLAGTALAGRRFDLVIDTQRRLLTTMILRRVPHGRLVTGARPKPAAMIDQLLALVEAASGLPAETAFELRLGAPLEAAARALLPEGPVYVGLAPGAGGRHKCWPLENYQALAQRLAEGGRQAVILLGPAEAEWHEGLARALPEARFPLQEAQSPDSLLTIALAQRLAAAVANDAGIGHMLAAADCPLVSLFGPTPPTKFAPLVSRGEVIRAQDFGGDEMAAIPVDAVADALEALLAEGSGRMP
ncbi:MAG: glycosyltransferase family 9 protein [Pseudomonadota bacterium]